MLEEKEVAKDGEVTPLGEVVVVVGIHLITTTSTTRLLDLLSPDHSSSTSIITSTTRLLDRRDLPPVPVLPPRARRCCRRCSAAPRRTGART